MPPRSRNTAAALRVAAALCVLAASAPCWSAPTGDPRAVATSTEDDGLYKGEDGAYQPEADPQQGADDAGAYIPEKYETDESAGEGTYDAKKYETVEGFDDGTYHPQDDLEDHDDGSYHPEIAEMTVGDDGSYHGETDDTVGDEGAYHPDIAEKVLGDDGSYHPDSNVDDVNNEGAYDPEIYEKVVGDDHQEDDGLYHPEIHERSDAEESGQKPETTLDAASQVQPNVYNGVADEGGQSIRVKRHQSEGDSFQHGSTLEERTQQEDDGAYHPEKYETPAPEGAEDWDRYWTEGAVTADGGSATPAEDTSEASDDGSYRAEHHKAEDYDERADSGLNTVTSPVEPTEASDDGSYRPQQHTETPTEDYDERADNGTDWRDNVVEHHDEGVEAADDGSYRPLEHGPRARRAASEDTEEVQLSPVVFQVGPKPSSDVSSKASGSVKDDIPQPADRTLPAAAA